MSKKLTITVSEEMFRRIETLGILFPWLTEDTADYGYLIEERTGWLFEEQVEDTMQLETEIENIDFESKESAEAMLARYRGHVKDDEPNSVRMFSRGEHWKIRFFVPGSNYERLWDICAARDLNYEEHSQKLFAVKETGVRNDSRKVEAFFASLEGKAVAA